MTQKQRQMMYSGWLSTPYPYAVSLAFVAFSVWFVFFYRGRLSTHGRKIATFGMALAALGGMVVILVSRIVWQI
jgi:hypothetical protein